MVIKRERLEDKLSEAREFVEWLNDAAFADIEIILNRTDHLSARNTLRLSNLIQRALGANTSGKRGALVKEFEHIGKVMSRLGVIEEGREDRADEARKASQPAPTKPPKRPHLVVVE
ncbi:MAG: hypothetical protein V4449_03380 [Patescibacteria group bacterium]